MFDRVGKTDPVTRGIEITVNYLGIQFDVRHTRMPMHTPAEIATCHVVSCKDYSRPIIISLPAFSAVNLLVIAFDLFPHGQLFD